MSRDHLYIAGDNQATHHGHQEEEPDRIGDKARQQQEKSRNEQECPVEHLEGGNIPPVQAGADTTEHGQPLEPNQNTPDHRGQDGQADGGEGADPGAHLNQQIELEDGKADKEQEKNDQIRGLMERTDFGPDQLNMGAAGGRNHRASMVRISSPRTRFKYPMTQPVLRLRPSQRP